MKQPKIDMAFLKKRPLSSSSLREFAKSPRHYIHYIMNGKKETKALHFGKLFDSMTLTPGDFKKKYAILPEDKKAHAKFILKHPGRIYITSKDHEQAVAMKESIMDHAEASKLVKGIKLSQHKLTWTDKATGLPMIAYIDGRGHRDRAEVTTELKSSQDASKDAFERDAFYMGYHIQTGLYAKGYAARREFPHPYYIVADKSEPYAVNVFRCTDDFIKAGKAVVDDLLVRFIHCMKGNLWHQGYEFYTAVGYAQLDLPYFAKRKIED